ncbi:MAG: hypothetical protein P8Y45_20735, partial [Exilibacterium sp.]
MKNRVLARVDFYHSYFENGIFSGVKVEPLSETTQILRNFRAGIKHHDGSFRLFINVDNSCDSFINLAVGTRLYFRLVLTDPDWPLMSEHNHFCSACGALGI